MLIRSDELNVLKGNLTRLKGNLNEIVGLITDWLFLAYADGKTDVEEQLNGETVVSVDHVMDVISAEIGGKNVYERITDDVYLEDLEALGLLVENERERVYNTAGYDTATKLGAINKTWHTQGDDKVRDSHFYLDGVTKPLNEAYHTIWGNSGQHPGGFSAPEDDINCRCWLTYSN